jgi:hypothetical protein
MVLPAAVVRADSVTGVVGTACRTVPLAFGVLELRALIDCRASNIAPPDHQQQQHLLDSQLPLSHEPNEPLGIRLFPVLSRDTTQHTQFKSGPPGSEWPPWPHKTGTRLRASPCRRATHYRCRRRRRLRSGIFSTRGYGVNARQKSRVCLHVPLRPIRSSGDHHPPRPSHPSSLALHPYSYTDPPPTHPPTYLPPINN